MTSFINALFVLTLLLPLSLLLPACGGDKQPADKESMEKPAPQPPAADAARGEQTAQGCFKCHPADGHIVNEAYPQINGLPQDYLHKSLLDYSTGARKHEEMNQAVQPLDKQQILEVAAYYSSLKTPWKIRVAGIGKPSAAPSARDIDAGKELAGPCMSCHGQNGNSTTEGVPSLAGLSRKYLTSAMVGYFTGLRDDDIMKVFKDALDKDKIAKLGAFFSVQQRTLSALPIHGNAAAGEKLANQHCIGCHGEGGNSFLKEFPSLAGQNYKFLYEAILSYTNGKRKNRGMQTAVRELSNTNVKNLAAYYATQMLAPPQPAAVDSNEPKQAAANAAKSCFGCHGKDGNSRSAGTPNLSGLHPAYLANAITQYQTNDRQHTLMKNFAGGLDALQIELTSIHFGSQEPTARFNAGKGNPENAKDVIGGCESCHGAKGVSSTKTPGLAGQDATYLRAALASYKNKSRNNSEMQNAVAGLSDQDFTNLASYFAAQTPVKPPVSPLQTPLQLAEKCNRCHGVTLDNPEMPVPRIAGQSEAYLLKTLYDYKTKARDNSAMFAMLDVLSNWEIAQLAGYYARLNSDGN
ncbi:MAG TPA: c-type cytochrome [Gammaproteobacteria bacterium]